MAGSYPDVPGPLIAYDKLDTTLVCYGDNGSVIWNPYNTGEKKAILSTGSGGIRFGSSGLVMNLTLVLPELYDIVGYAYYGHSMYSTGDIKCAYLTSPDTVDGSQGTWTERVAYPAPSMGQNSAASARTRIQPVSWTGVNGVRLRWNGTGNTAGAGDPHLGALHLYGAPSAASLTANPDRLRFWLPTTDAVAPAAHFDFGDLKPGQTGTKTFRLKNNSSTKTAQTITLSREVLTEPAVTTLGEYSFSLDGTTWAASVTVPNLAPGALSGVLHVRRVVGSGATTGTPAQARLAATAATWA